MTLCIIFGPPADKEKFTARLLTALTVLFLIIAGSPLADVNTQTASAGSNPYALAPTGQATFIGGGAPASDTQTLENGDTITYSLT